MVSNIYNARRQLTAQLTIWLDMCNAPLVLVAVCKMSLVFVCVDGDAIKETFDNVKCRSLSRQLRRALNDTELNKALEQLDMLERAAVADRAGVIDFSRSRAGRGFNGSIYGLGWVKFL